MSLTIDDIQVEKLELKHTIERLLKIFENKTNCTITKITGRRVEYFINQNDSPEIKSYMGINLIIKVIKLWSKIMDDTLTIPEIMIKKEAMCDLIIDMIEHFEKQTGLCVKSIDIERIRTIGDKCGQALVNIEVCL